MKVKKERIEKVQTRGKLDMKNIGTWMETLKAIPTDWKEWMKESQAMKIM